jgi:hypothetical protein
VQRLEDEMDEFRQDLTARVRREVLGLLYGDNNPPSAR